MAGSIRSLSRLSVGLMNNILSRTTCVTGARFLYTERALGINNYENVRMNYRNQFTNVDETFRTKMMEICENDKNMVFTEDLKAMLHLAHKKQEDLDLLLKMMIKFNVQNKELRFGTFIFGPVVMRTYYFLNEPDAALQAYKTPELEGFFDQIVTYQILMCLLYKNKRFSDVREVYDILRTKQVRGQLHPRNCLLLVLASCFQENTPEVLQYALDIWKDARDRAVNIPRRGIAFVAALACKQGSPEIALEILSVLRSMAFIDTRCIKLLAYADLNKFTEIIPLLRQSLDNDKLYTRKECYFIDTIDKLKARLASENIEPDHEIHKLVQQLEQNGHIFNTELDSFLVREIDMVAPQKEGFGKTGFRSLQNIQRNPQMESRTGLRDLI